MKSQESDCPLCTSQNTEFKFKLEESRLYQCDDCEILYASPFSDFGVPIFSAIDTKSKRLYSDIDVKRAASHRYLSKLNKRESLVGRKIMVAGQGSRELCEIATNEAIDSIEVNSNTLPQGPFDACVLLDALGEKANPVTQLISIRERLCQDGLLLITVTTLYNPQTRRQTNIWQDSDRQPTFVFSIHSLTALLVRCGFCHIVTWPEQDGVLVLCRKSQLVSRPTRLSIVIPVYNEYATFETLINRVLNKKIENIEKEIIIVESNSKDGTRELTKHYEYHPNIKVIYEDMPNGKGHAVRIGLEYASGDIILIQDADLEYDVEDYDDLLTPIITQRKLFVLGSRHPDDWNIREFQNWKIISNILNLAHIFFTWLINITCGVSLRDPFTMYKVFHRECLYGLKLEANRFDLDWEIVIKFIRKGFVPIEIPINYASRSFSEGKKIHLILDPLLWIFALFKFRYGQLYSVEKHQDHT